MVLQRDFIEVKGDDLFIDEVSSINLVKEYGTPLFVMSKGHICSRLDKLQEMMTKYPNTLPLFASKSFSCLAIYKLAKQYDIGIDVVSSGEMSIALKAGFNKKKIYFHGNNKLPSEIEYAIKNGVENFVVDNFYEIELIQKYALQYNVIIQATMRVTPGVTAGNHEYIQTGATDTKFGFSSHDETYLKAIQAVLDCSHIEFVGIHCHIGSQIEDIQAYVDAMHKFVQLSYEIYDTFGIVIKKLNAGGGYGIAYTKEDKPLDFDLITDTIMDIITKGFKAKGFDVPMVLIEPGRYVVGNAGVTLYTVGAYKDIPGVRKYISVDGGMTDNIRVSLYDAKYEALVVNKASKEKDTVVTVAGKNCESGDILCKDVALSDPQPGDILAMFTTGAYHYSMASNYNQLPKPAVVFTHEGESKVVVRRQTFDDLLLFDEQ
ncbi:diaminopimelate decarboxylase [Tannockella kyphosi]|uniref:diaminopimelate decarboxylase n=1 Tax=Tannockella kyphosi TaxID=2899121 RepID=UPI00201254BF|nr:diaminopimelate decarboxylase [Tannockella kyphosi]